MWGASKSVLRGIFIAFYLYQKRRKISNNLNFHFKNLAKDHFKPFKVEENSKDRKKITKTENFSVVKISETQS